jgi:hypothetical protein
MLTAGIAEYRMCQLRDGVAEDIAGCKRPRHAILSYPTELLTFWVSDLLGVCLTACPSVCLFVCRPREEVQSAAGGWAWWVGGW